MRRRAGEVEARSWGAGCTSWDLLDRGDLRFTQEHMPPGTAETRHHHVSARQFFFVLNGRLVIESDDAVVELAAHDGLEVPPGRRHRVRNDGPAAVEFIVVAAPTTRGDRVEAH